MANAILLEPMVPAAISMFGSVPTFDFTTGAMPAGASITRASGKYRTTVGGLLASVANDTAAFDYDPVTHAALGILIEPAATNLVLQSGAFDSASWPKVAVGVTANYANGPTGTALAERMLIDTTTGGHYVNQQPNVTGDVTMSLYVKRLTGRYVYIYSIGRTPTDTINQPFWVFDLLNGVIQTGSGPAGYTATITAAPNGFWRITVSGTSTSAARELRFALTDATGSQSFLGNGTDDILAWGTQMESGKVATSLIDTTTAAASRSADALVLNWAAKSVPDGSYTLRYTFDDGSTQDVATTVAGGNSLVPTNLNRPWVKTVQLLGFTSPTLDLGVASNLLNDYAGVVAQTSCTIGATNQAKIQIDMGANVSVDTILVFGLELFPTNGNLIVNYATQAQGPFTGAFSTDTSGSAYAGSLPLTTGKGVSIWLMAAPVTARYFQIVYEAVVGGKSVRASRVAIGQRIQLQRNFSYGAGPGVKDLGSLDFSARAVLQRRTAKKLRTLTLTFSNLKRDEVQASVRPMLERQGNTGMVAVVTDPSVDADRQNKCYYGALVGDLNVVQRNAVGWETKVNVVSIF